jgi:hypothetical protein
VLPCERQAPVDALALHSSARRGTDDRRSHRIEVLSANVVEPVVVGAQQGADGW